MYYEIINSGSSGNCIVINDIMIDCGVPFFKIKEYLYDIKYLIITHIHSDHVKKSTLDHIKKMFPKIKIIGNHEVHQVFGVHIISNASFPIEVPGYTFWPFLLEHDVLTYGYTWKYNNLSIIYATDTSSLEYAPDQKYDYFFLESNHDEKKVEAILKNTGNFKYNAYAGAKRHLSTQQCKLFYFLNRRNRESKLIELHKSSRFY